MFQKVSTIFFLLTISLTFTGQLNIDTIFNNYKHELDSFPNNFYLSVALVNKQDVYHIGFKKENDSIFKFELKDSLFEIGSITKTFTATLLAEEIVNNNLKETDFINKQFPFKFKNKTKLSYVTLANHTSGLYRLPSNIAMLAFENPENPYLNYSIKELEHYLKNELVLDNQNISKFSYSNLGAGLLGQTISKKAKKPIEQLTREKILSKYGMNATSYTVNTSIIGLDKNSNATGNWDMNALKAAGGIVSNTHDLSKYILAHFNSENKVLSLTRKPTHYINKEMAIGLGWFIKNPLSDKEICFHDGGTGGFTSCMAFSTTNKTGVIVLSNINMEHKEAILIDQLCFKLMDYLD